MSTILYQFRKKKSVLEIRNAINSGPDGTHLKDIVNGAFHLGLETDLFTFESEDDLKTIPLPALVMTRSESTDGTISNAHFLVLQSVDEKNVILSDPAWGVVQIKTSDFYQKAARFAVSFANNKVSENFAPKSFFNSLYIESRKYSKSLFAMLLLSIFHTLVSVGSPFLYASLIDKYLTKSVVIGGSDWVVYLTCLLSIVLFRFILSMTSLSFSADFSKELLIKTIRSVLGLKYSDFITRRGRDYFSSLASSDMVQSLIRDIFSSMIAETLALIGFSIAIFVISPKLTIYVIFGSIPVILITAYMHRIRKSILYKINLYSGDWSVDFAEIITKFKTIKLLKSEDYFFTKSKSSLDSLYNANYKMNRISYASNAVIDIFTTLCSGLLLLYGSYLVSRNEISLGDMIIASGYISSVWQYFTTFESRSRTYQEAKIAFEKINLLTETSQSTQKGEYCLGKVNSLKLVNVSFHYKVKKDPVLDGVNLNAKLGEIVCIVGPSGSGKSTLLAIIGKLLDPSIGKYFLNELDSISISEESFRSRVAYVEQDLNLFSGPLINNLYQKIPSFEEISRAKKLFEVFGISQSIESLPKGIYSHVTDASKCLSGGELQRLIIVRALCKNPSLLILDEPTSALDESNENLLFEQLCMIPERPLIILSTHRYNALKFANQVVYLEQGKVTKLLKSDKNI